MKQSKNEQLAEDYGFSDVMDMLEMASIDSMVPGICVNDDCNYSTDVEPDQREGYCENCGTQTVQSCLIIEEII